MGYKHEIKPALVFTNGEAHKLLRKGMMSYAVLEMGEGT